MKPMINFKTIIITLLYFSISLLHLHAYDPIDRFNLNCGTTGNSTDGQRTWTGDINSKLLSSLQNNPTTISVPKTTQNPSINKIPYSTARLSHSIFNYSLPVTTGPKFLRLFFYPTTYTNGFNRYDASFTVISNGFTLLKDFNASLNADVEGVDDTILKEYVINVGDDQRLDLSFIPSSGNSNNYGFINGIEVLSMPDDLYYTPLEDPGFSLVGSTIIPAYTISSNVALETGKQLS